MANVCAAEGCDKPARWKFCSYACASKTRWAPVRARREANPPRCQWPGCATLSGWTVCQTTRIPRKYCADHLGLARARAARMRPRKPSVVRECAQCGKEFTPKPGAAAGKYCSQQCWGKSCRGPKYRYRRCRHCRKSSVTRPRGLCWNCYYKKPGVRDLYPPDPRSLNKTPGPSEIAARARLVREGKL